MSFVRKIFRIYTAGAEEKFSIEIGELEILDQGITAIMGPSGSGKSSIFRILTGLDDCPTLEWKLQSGIDIAKLSVRDRRLGVVFQSYELFSNMTAEENIKFAGKVRNRKSSDITADLKRWSARLQIESILKRKTENLSGGEKQRVALVRALMGKPRMLLLDEPFSALDIALRNEARDLVRQTLEEAGIPALIVTHDQQDVDALAQKVIRIRAGRLAESDR